MRSKTYICRYTPAVLDCACRSRGVTPDELRLATLKRVDCELGNLLDPGVAALGEELRESLGDLAQSVRLAIGDE